MVVGLRGIEAGIPAERSGSRLLGSGSGGRKQAPGVGDDERRRRVPLKGRGLYGQGVRVRVFRFWLASCQQDPVWDCEAFLVCARAYSFSCQIGSGSFGGGAGHGKKA